MISGNRRRGDIEHQEKTFTDYAAAVKRRLTVALVSFVVVLVGGVYLLANAVPAKYRSTGVISIERQDVSRDLVQTAVMTYADEQIELVWQKVMSPVTLPAIVEKYGLYPDIVASDPSLRNASLKLRNNTLLERQSIEFKNPQTGRTNYATIAFSLSFDHADAATAQQIATELVNLYLTENVESRSNQAQITVDFLKLDSASARAEVDRAGIELARFKDRHAGNLPELLNFNLQSIERTEQQLDNLDREIRDSRNRQFMVETELARTNPFSNAVDADGNPILGTAERLAELQTERLRLLSIYTPAHSDVIRIEREIKILTGGAPASAGPDPVALRAQLDTMLMELQQARRTFTDDHPDVVRLNRSANVLEQQLEQALSAGPQQSSLAALASRDPVVQQLRQQVQTEQSYLQSLLRRRSELEGKLGELRRRVAAMPQIEREYEVLTQQSEFAVARYNEAVGRIDTAQRAQTLEVERGSEIFTLIEAPFLPEESYATNRLVLVMLAIMVALGIGIGLAILIDNLDDSVKDSKELEYLTGAPPLAVIPVLETQSDERRRFAAIVAKSAFFFGGLATAVGIAVSTAG